MTSFNLVFKPNTPFLNQICQIIILCSSQLLLLFIHLFIYCFFVVVTLYKTDRTYGLTFDPINFLCNLPSVTTLLARQIAHPVSIFCKIPLTYLQSPKAHGARAYMRKIGCKPKFHGFQHATITRTGITCKKIPSVCRWFIVKKARIF